jgi:hypothetical protein
VTDEQAAIEAELTRAMELANLREASRRLQDARVKIKNLRHLAFPDDVADGLLVLVDRIENEEWRIEQRLLAKADRHTE